MKTNPRNLFKTLAAIALTACTLSTAVASNPAVPYVMTTGNYLETFGDIANWGAGFASGIGAGPWSTNAVNATGTIPGLGTNITTTTAQAPIAAGTGGGVQKGTGNLLFLSTGSTDNSTAVAADLNLDFTATNTGTLSFDWAVVFNSTGNRAASLRVFATTNGTDWTELTAAAVLNMANNVTASGTISAVALPLSFSNCPTARLRFYDYNGTGGTTGSRPKFSIDNVAVVSTPTGGPQAPVITGISPTGITNGVGTSASFTVTATGTPAPSYYWFKEIPGTSTNLVAGATTAILSFPSAAVSDTGFYQVVASNSVAPFVATSAVVSLVITDTPPNIVSITPLASTNTAGTAASFTVTATGTAPLGYYWFKEIPGTSTNLIAAATTATLSFPATAVSDTASYQVVVSNSIAPFVATSAVVSLVVTAAPPVITGFGPLIVSQNAGLNVTFLVTNTGTPPLTYLLYKGTPGASAPVVTGTNSPLTLVGVLGGDAGNYQVVVTNSSGSATSSVAVLTVTGDPHIASQPVNAYGLLKSVVKFNVGVIGTSPTYLWYYTDINGTQIAPVADGTLPSGSVISGSTTSTLTFSNLQATDPTNFVVVVNGSLSSQVASLLTVASTNTLAFWDFNGLEFTNTFNNPTALLNPVPYIGSGTASVFGTPLAPGTSPFSGSVDGNNGIGFSSYPVGAYPAGYPEHLPPFSWGTSTYPTNGNPANNKSAGVQYNVSTTGAKNIRFSFEARTSATASRYYRVQYTTNGTDWVDYPASSTFGTVSSTYLPFSFDFTGFTGVVNNPSFGVRVVSEYQSTATYGNITTNSYVGVSNNYGTGGTMTYDLVTFTGDSVTNNNAPPTISSFTNVTMVDYLPYTNAFTVGDDSTPAGSLSVSAVSLSPANFNPTFEFGGSGANRTMIIHPNSIAQTFAATPILVTVTDGNGDSTATWFTATVGTINLPPTNSLTTFPGTNTLANKSLKIAFTVGDDRTLTNALTYDVSSGNTTLVPNDTVNNLVLSGVGTATPSLTIFPATNQLGQGTITVIVHDNDTAAPKDTPATFPFMVRPNTNVIGIDYFTYDTAGSLDVVSGGYWKQLSGGFGQLTVSGGVAKLDTVNRTENVQALLLGAPYLANSTNILYASYIINVDSQNMPRANGSYVTMFNDNSGNTSDIECAVVVATNGAASGYYRLGINNRVGAVATNSQMYAVDLLPDSNYVVVVSLTLTNGISKLWVNPNTSDSASVTDSSALTTKFNISNFELRESGAGAGIVGVSHLKVGKTFDSVFPSLQPRLAGLNVVIDWSDATLPVESATDVVGPYSDLGAQPPYTNNASTNTKFYRFKRQ